MITGASFGLWSLALGVATYVLTRWWVVSERVFEARQKAYSDFLKGTLGIEYRFLMSPEQSLVPLFDGLRETSADFSLYASDKANDLAGAYLGKIADLITAEGTRDDLIPDLLRAASTLQSELAMTLRADTLGWTAFGFWSSAQRRLRSMFPTG